MRGARSPAAAGEMPSGISTADKSLAIRKRETIPEVFMSSALVPGVFLLALTGCQTLAPMAAITLPDGTKGYAASCDSTMVRCYQQASRVCPHGYDVKENNENSIEEGDGYAAGFGAG